MQAIRSFFLCFLIVSGQSVVADPVTMEPVSSATLGTLTQFFPNHENAEALLLPYLTHQRPVKNPDGVLTVVTSNTYDMGDTAYAQVITELLAEAYPERKIRIIIETTPENKHNLERTFRFPKNAEVLILVVDEEPDKNLPLALEWQDNASLIIMASSPISPLSGKKHQYISFSQLDTPPKNRVSEIQDLTNSLENFHDLDQALAMDKETRAAFSELYWNTRLNGDSWQMELADNFQPLLNSGKSFYNIAEKILPQCSFEQSLPFDTDIDVSVNDIVDSILGNDDDDEDETAQNIDLTFFSTSSKSRFGLDSDNLGILLKPSLLKLIQKSPEAPLHEPFMTLLSDYPTLASYLQRTTVSSDQSKNGQPTFYMAYMHSLLSFAEYIAIVSHLNPDTTPVILSNISKTTLQDPVFTEFLAHQGISRIIYTNLKGNPATPADEAFDISNKGKEVHLITLPVIPDDTQYLSLFAHAEQPVGITGNTSLFNAIALKKIPVYDTRHSFQKGVNESLKRFDVSGHLHAVFDNRIQPQAKAEAIKLARENVDAWAEHILNNKLANQMLVTMVDLLISDRGRQLFNQLEQLQTTPSEYLTDYEQDVKAIRGKIQTLTQLENQKKCLPNDAFYKLNQAYKNTKSDSLIEIRQQLPTWLFYEEESKEQCDSD